MARAFVDSDVGEGVMYSCNFIRLVQLLDKNLDLNGRLEVLGHLDACEICREAIYQISRDRDRAFFIFRPLRQAERVA